MKAFSVLHATKKVKWHICDIYNLSKTQNNVFQDLKCSVAFHFLVFVFVSCVVLETERLFAAFQPLWLPVLLGEGHPSHSNPTVNCGVIETL